jgi:hypothetical protein
MSDAGAGDLRIGTVRTHREFLLFAAAAMLVVVAAYVVFATQPGDRLSVGLVLLAIFVPLGLWGVRARVDVEDSEVVIVSLRRRVVRRDTIVGMARRWRGPCLELEDGRKVTLPFGPGPEIVEVAMLLGFAEPAAPPPWWRSPRVVGVGAMAALGVVSALTAPEPDNPERPPIADVIPSLCADAPSLDGCTTASTTTTTAALEERG